MSASFKCKHCGHWDWEGTDWWHKRTFGHQFEAASEGGQS